MPTTNFHDLYASSFARLVGQVTIVTADRQAAEDAVQEAFGRLWKRWDTLAAYDRPEAWVRRVAINVAISHWRRARRLRPFGPSGPGATPDEAGSKEDEAMTRHDVQQALRSLPVTHRQALLLHHVVGLSVAEVARDMHVPEGTVKSWLFRGREALHGSIGAAEAPRE